MVFACVVVRAAPLTVATYNVENYGPAGRMTGEGFRPDYPKPEPEKQALRRVICALNADVLVVQEMGDQPYLDELRRDLRSDGCDYPYAALAVGGDPDRHVAILAKRPLRGVRTVDLHFAYLGGREHVKRGLLQATIGSDGGDIVLFAFHLKSRLTDRPEDPQSEIRRAAEATAIRNAVLAQFPNPAAARYILIGDANDNPASKALQHLQHRGDTAIAALLPAADSRGEAWTYRFAREDSYARVDHILLSPALAGGAVDHMARIFDGDDVGQASDHRPVFVRLDLRRP